MTKKKIGVTMVCMLGLILLIKTQTRYNYHENGLIDVVNPLDDHNSTVWLGLGLVFMYNMFSSQAEVLRCNTRVSMSISRSAFYTSMCQQSAAGVTSFWSAVGGLVTAALSAFFSSEPSLLSGAMPSPMHIFLLVSLSISAIAMVVSIAQAETLVDKTAVTAVR